MLDIKSRLVLKILVKECGGGTYKIIEVSDVISAMPSRYRVDSEGLEHILTYLERQDCISIKYDDDGTYCLCVLPYGFELAENDTKKEPGIKPKFYLLTIFCFFAALLGGFAGAMIAAFL